MKIHSIVIVNLGAPKQRFIGRLLELTTAGVTVRGVDLDAFEDWMNHLGTQEESGVQPTTTFFPLHRVEKMILDEGLGAIPSLSATFLSRVGGAIEEYLEHE
jgi:hypothetical protein